MDSYTVEFTTDGRGCPQQVDVRAADPGEALMKAINAVQLQKCLRQYDDASDPGKHYVGWSFVTISINCVTGQDGTWIVS